MTTLEKETSAPSETPKNTVRKRLLLTFGIPLLFFVVCEIILRLMVSSDTVLNINIGGMKDFHPTRRAQLKKGYSTKDFSINSLGLLGPEISIEKAPNTVRILNIGNSVTFSPPGENYSIFMEEKLDALNDKVKVEAIAGAVPGYSSYEALDWYDEFLHELHPDIAVIYLGWNDMGQYNPFGLRFKNENLYQKPTFMGWLMKNIYLFRIGYFINGRAERSKEVDTSPLTAEEAKVIDEFYPHHYEQNLVELINKLKKQGASVYLMTMAGIITYEPTPEELKVMHFPRNFNKKFAKYKGVYEKYQQALDKVLAKTKIPVIDIRELIKDPEVRKRFFTDTMHVTPTGARAFAEYIVQIIEPKVKELILLHEN